MAASGFHEDGEVGFEEGMLWLPSHVLDEDACDSKVYMRKRHQKQQHQSHHRISREPHSQYYQKCYSSRSSYGERLKRAAGGPGMQALFLGSGQGSCGTGVFLPQKAGNKPTRKPAYAPVLLPARVVEALNLKVHALGLHISLPPQVPKYNPRYGEVCTNNDSITKKKKDQKGFVSKQQCNVISQNQSSSSPAEIFLPKEWTY